MVDFGWRKKTIKPGNYPNVTRNYDCLDFSGWPIFCHADLPEARVAQICEALDARKAHIPWQGDGPLPVERMCRDAADTPLDVPLHPGAERYWKSVGYL